MRYHQTKRRLACHAYNPPGSVTYAPASPPPHVCFETRSKRAPAGQPDPWGPPGYFGPRHGPHTPTTARLRQGQPRHRATLGGTALGLPQRLPTATNGSQRLRRGTGMAAAAAPSRALTA